MVRIRSYKDVIMLLLYARGHTGEQEEPIRGRTRLMKMVFLFKEEVRRQLSIPESEVALPDFSPYDYGPFSADVFRDLEFLVDLQFVKVGLVGVSLEDWRIGSREYEYWQAGEVAVDEETQYQEEEFSLTPRGCGFVSEGRAGELSQEQWAILDAFKARCTAVPLRALLRYVYANYPGMTTESKIRDEILC